MSKITRKRVSALLVSAVMATTSLAVTSGSSFFVNAAEGKTVSIGKTLATSQTNPDDKDHPLNEKNCTYMCKAKTDTWTLFTDTTGKSPADIYGENITSLQFNFKSDQMVTDFSYYVGASDTKDNDYWWDIKKLTGEEEAPQVHPYAKEFSVVVNFPASVTEELAKSSSKFQIQNCYTGLINEEDKTTRTQDADIELVSITVNGTTDTSNGEKPDWIKEVDPNLPKGAENTGGLNYSSSIGNGEVVSVEQDGENMTVKTQNSLKLDNLDIKLTPGDNCSEDYYASDAFKEANGGIALTSESAIREAGLPLNSHKFTYGDFNFNPGSTVAEGAKVTALSVTLKLDNTEDCVNRIMYGGGLNVENKSLADTEYAKAQAGLKGQSGDLSVATAGYWYNDVGAETLKECTDAGVNWGNDKGDFTVGGGTDLAKQELGSYFTVTWDVPEQVIDCETTLETSQISFQLWYASLTKGVFKDCTIVSAALTYEEELTFPCTDSASVKNAGSESIGNSTEIKYSDFGMKYEKTADVYAVAFDITTDQDANQVQLGVGSTVLEKAGLKDNWFQSDDLFKKEGGNSTTPTLLYWEKSTAGSRPDANDNTVKDAAYQNASGKKTYTYLWIPPATLATGIREKDGKLYDEWNQISTETEDAHLSFGVWYANLGETVSKNYTINNVTVYYAADDQKNEAKRDMFEDPLEVVDSIDVKIGEKYTLDVNVPGCTGTLKISNLASVAANPENDNQLIITGKNVGSTILTITTPGGQTKDITLNVLAEVTETTTTTSTTTTSNSATTTTTSKTTATTSSSASTTTTSKTTATSGSNTGTTSTEPLVAFYGDVNCDGRVDISDAVLLNKAVAGAVTLSTAQQILNSDCDANGETGSNDALVLLKFLVSLVTELPCTD